MILSTKLECKRCGHRWMPRVAKVKSCPNCKSRLWDVPKDKSIDKQEKVS